MIQLLLDYKANVNVVNNSGYTPLIKAICCHNVEIVELLFDHESNIDIVNEYLEKPQHLRQMRFHKDMLECLLKNGTKIDFQMLMSPPEFFYVGFWSPTCILESWMKFADINTINSDGKDFLEHCVKIAPKNWPKLMSWKIYLRRIAKFQALDVTIASHVFKSISSQDTFKDFQKVRGRIGLS